MHNWQHEQFSYSTHLLDIIDLYMPPMDKTMRKIQYLEYDKVP